MQAYKWILANLIGIWNLRWTNTPCKEDQEYSSRVMLQKLVSARVILVASFFLDRLLLASEKVVRLFKTMNADHECWARRRIFKFFFLLNIHDTGCRTNTSITFLGCFNQLCLTCLRTRNTLFRGLRFRWHKLQQPLFLSIPIKCRGKLLTWRKQNYIITTSIGTTA